jgi:quinol monooxygenase YgiN
VFCYIWEYVVASEHVDAFIAAYGGDGPWVRLFRRAPAYLGTELHQDAHDSRRFITIDYWTSHAECAAFRHQVADEFAQIDEACGRFTERERHLGDFESPVPRP